MVISRRAAALLGIVAAATVLLSVGYAIGGAPDLESQTQPTVVLIGVDGFGWDFREKASTPNLDRLIDRGVTTERLVAVFPTKTFPNFYTIATGLYTEHHGIISNTMYDAVFDARFDLGSRDAVGDGRWWEGEPIWVNTENHGLIAATFFWPGTEAPIQGVRPTHWKEYDGDVPNRERVEQVLAWLDLPAEDRPSLITLYFSDVDHWGHVSGPDSREVEEAIREVDRAIGLLLSGLEAREITDQVNVVVVSDHGMAATSPDRMILIDDYIDLSVAGVVDWNPVLALRPEQEHEQVVYGALVDAHPHLSVYRKAEIPGRFHYQAHRRIAPIIGVADDGWSISNHDYFRRRRERFAGGMHGYDPELKSMGAFFVAAGPAFEEGLVVPPFQNIHIYELLCAVLGLKPAPNDGSLDSVRVMLRD